MTLSRLADLCDERSKARNHGRAVAIVLMPATWRELADAIREADGALKREIALIRDVQMEVAR
jgi:hypothetical protein